MGCHGIEREREREMEKEREGEREGETEGERYHADMLRSIFAMLSWMKSLLLSKARIVERPPRTSEKS